MSYGGKTEILEGSKNSKFRIGIPNLTFEGCFEVKMIFKNILEVPAVIPAQFPYKIIRFSIKSKPN